MINVKIDKGVSTMTFAGGASHRRPRAGHTEAAAGRSIGARYAEEIAVLREKVNA